ncbi:Ppx/GppA phosphatase family protein [Bifidobacterium bifidum]|uniref:Ppx/GppA phosphatase family protein n=1 Tax=Bifidobacterium bifidum TaxID=1681 RepID=UPI0006419EA7|nr:exopolyphosphatase [Bifidobacterium bifidum]KLN90229.1 exopolyphosphatase [Bifidobacterium bifidum]
MVNLRSRVTRLGVLDIGSNTIHMLIVDAAPGARPDPEASTKSTVRLMQYVKDDGSIKKSGIEAILTAVDQCMELAEEYDITQLLAMATSAIKEAPNSNKILRKIEERIGQSVTVLSGTDEARLTFLAARRVPQIQASGACVGTSKTFRSLARLAGAVLRQSGREDTWIMTREQLEDWIPRLAAIEPEQRVALPGITPERTMQIVGGGIVADEIMRSLNVHEVEICPWALREGAILRWLDQFGRTRLGF